MDTPYNKDEQEAYNDAYNIVREFKDSETVLIEIIKNLILKSEGKKWA